VKTHQRRIGIHKSGEEMGQYVMFWIESARITRIKMTSRNRALPRTNNPALESLEVSINLFWAA
jgi:hypothetical protein